MVAGGWDYRGIGLVAKGAVFTRFFVIARKMKNFENSLSPVSGMLFRSTFL